MSIRVVKRCANCNKYMNIDIDLYELKYQDKYKYPKPVYFCCPSCMRAWKETNKITSISDQVMADLRDYLEEQRKQELKFIRANRQIILKRKAQAEYDLKRLDLLEKQINEKYDLQK